LPLDDIRDAAAEFLALPTNQRAREDLVATGEAIEREKDRLLNVFMDFARPLCEKIRADGFWADYIDPCSGLPMLTLNCNKYVPNKNSQQCPFSVLASSNLCSGAHTIVSIPECIRRSMAWSAA